MKHVWLLIEIDITDDLSILGIYGNAKSAETAKDLRESNKFSHCEIERWSVAP